MASITIIMIYIVLNVMWKVMLFVVIHAHVYITLNVLDWQHYRMVIGHVLNVKYVFQKISLAFVSYNIFPDYSIII
jgi:hypothetical protein